MTYSLLERRATNGLLLLTLHWIIDQDTGVEDMNFSIGEDLDPRQKGAMGVSEGVWQEEAKDKSTQDGETSHKDE